MLAINKLCYTKNRLLRYPSNKRGRNKKIEYTQKEMKASDQEHSSDPTEIKMRYARKRKNDL